jgi:predicted nucleic acid-binding protein
MAILVDSSVIIDVAGHDPVWEEWSTSMLRLLANTSSLFINQLIYAEVSVSFDSVDAVDEALPRRLLGRESIPFEAAYLAGKSFTAYRRRGGTRLSPLPDFYIGAHASVAGHEILTRDPTRFRTYFPDVRLITP